MTILSTDNYFGVRLSKSTALIKKWGNSTVVNGMNLRDLFIVEDISLWDMISTEMAIYHLPNMIDSQENSKISHFHAFLALKHLGYRVKYFLRRKKNNLTYKSTGQWPQGKTALFLGFSQYLSRDVIHPIARRLQADGKLLPVILIDGPPQSPNDLSIQEFSSILIQEKAQSFSEKANIKINIFKNTTKFKNITIDGGALYLQKKICSNLIFRIKEIVMRTSEFIAIARHILLNHHPAVVVSIDVADVRTRIFTQLAKFIGIPSVQIQAVPLDKGCFEWKFFEDDYVLVQGKISREVLINHGVSSEKILITGSPRFDLLGKETTIEEMKLRSRYAVQDRVVTLVLASTYTVPSYGECSSSALNLMKKTLFDVVAEVDNIRLIVKPHPLENITQTKSLAGNLRNISFAGCDENVVNFAKGCDVFMSFGSTATYEALAIGKPVICMGFSGWEDHLNDILIDSQAIELVTDKFELVKIIKEIEQDYGLGMLKRHERACKLFLDSMVFVPAEGAVKNICNELIKISTHHK